MPFASMIRAILIYVGDVMYDGASCQVEAMLKEREAARRRQELKDKLEAQRRKRDEEAERMMEEGGCGLHEHVVLHHWRIVQFV